MNKSPRAGDEKAPGARVLVNNLFQRKDEAWSASDPEWKTVPIKRDLHQVEASSTQPRLPPAYLTMALSSPALPMSATLVSDNDFWSTRPSINRKRNPLMAEKLDTGHSFPPMTLNMLDGSDMSLPGSSAYTVVLFYRGSF